jgi:hypothetical protein
MTGTYDSGLNKRYFLATYMSTAHNPSLTIANQVSISPGVPETFDANAPYLLFDEDELQEQDFWISVSDRRVVGAINTNSGAATTDDGEYHQFHFGFYNTFATEVEDPYPAYVFSASRSRTSDPSLSNTGITSLCEVGTTSGTSPGSYFYRSEDATWQVVENSDGFSADQERSSIMWPMARSVKLANNSDLVVDIGPVNYWRNIGELDRSSASNRLRPVPGTVAQHLPVPLTILHRPGWDSVDATLDKIAGQIDGVFHVFATDGTGATIANFSEDFITIGTDRYRVFATHVQKQLYHYICIKEDV